MTHDPFRLIFKRSQSGSRGKPTFSLQVSAEMTPEFERAAQDYGLWKEVIYADPKLEESRELNRPGFTGGSKDRINWSYGTEQEIKPIFT